MNKPKIRLVGGPFAGRVIADPAVGKNELVYRGAKRMTRKQRYEFERDQMMNPNYYGGYTGGPRVEARYRIAMGWFSNNSIINELHSTTASVGLVHAPLRHPDGSIFYEYVEGSKREFR